MMKDSSKDTGIQLNVLAVVGRTMIFVPIIITIISIIASLFGMDFDVQSLASGLGALFVCGIAILLYVAFRRFRQGIRGDL
jgi:Mg2+ and Co2+ transporter CorA